MKSFSEKYMPPVNPMTFTAGHFCVKIQMKVKICRMPSCDTFKKCKIAADIEPTPRQNKLNALTITR
ncbi:Uncharacterised protein [uncultured archaeon]|nr:Uncharacterised protein [uncultured archaeon]